MRVYLAVFMLMMAACSTTPAVTDTGAGVLVDVVHPADGTVVYAELLYAAGTAQGIAQAGFRLVLVDALENIIAQTVVYPAEDATWQVELPHFYQGEPSEMTLVALPLATEGDGYSSTTLIVSGLAHRPVGTFGSVRFPQAGMTVGGESILINGTISGLGDVPVRIKLIPEDDWRPLDSAVVESASPYTLDETHWELALSTAFYVGPARLVLMGDDDVVLAKVDVMISEAAG